MAPRSATGLLPLRPVPHRLLLLATRLHLASGLTTGWTPGRRFRSAGLRPAGAFHLGAGRGAAAVARAGLGRGAGTRAGTDRGLPARGRAGTDRRAAAFVDPRAVAAPDLDVGLDADRAAVATVGPAVLPSVPMLVGSAMHRRGHIDSLGRQPNGGRRRVSHGVGLMRAESADREAGHRG